MFIQSEKVKMYPIKPQETCETRALIILKSTEIFPFLYLLQKICNSQLKLLIYR